MKKGMLLLLVFLTTVSFAQEPRTVERELRKELRKEKKLERIRKYEEGTALGVSLMRDRDFVIHIDQISWGSLLPVQVFDNINFVKIDGDNIVVQIGIVGGEGVNGVGGETIQGKIQELEIRESSKSGRAARVSIKFLSPLLIDISRINLSISGDIVHATLNNRGVMTGFQGSFSSIEDSEIFESRNFTAY